MITILSRERYEFFTYVIRLLTKYVYLHNTFTCVIIRNCRRGDKTLSDSSFFLSLTSFIFVFSRLSVFFRLYRVTVSLLFTPASEQNGNQPLFIYRKLQRFEPVCLKMALKGNHNELSVLTALSARVN